MRPVVAWILALALSVLGGLMLPTAANAHALEPGFAEIRPESSESWRVTWRVPQVKGAPMGIELVLPDGCTQRRPDSFRFDGRAFVSSWLARCPSGMTSGPLVIEGLEATATDVLIRYIPELEASATSIRLTPDATSTILPAVPSTWAVLASYFWLGLDHIAGGIDHLLFVLALMLLVVDWRQLIWAITSFTIAHSITLGAATLGWITLPIPPVEAVIALSIVFLASEIVHSRDGKPRLSKTRPWLVAFAFGLLHGLGFASALREIGVPQSDIWIALLSFNLGVEAGQLMFVAVMLSAAAVTRLALPKVMSGIRTPGSTANVLVAYGIGSVAAYWTIERISGFAG